MTFGATVPPKEAGLIDHPLYWASWCIQWFSYKFCQRNCSLTLLLLSLIGWSHCSAASWLRRSWVQSQLLPIAVASCPFTGHSHRFSVRALVKQLYQESNPSSWINSRIKISLMKIEQLLGLISASVYCCCIRALVEELAGESNLIY